MYSTARTSARPPPVQRLPKESLETLYDRAVELVTAGSLQNPYFIEAVKKTRKLLYATEGTEAA